MVDEGAIRDALLAAQENLVVAFGAGPAALDVYFTNFEALKKQIIDASRLGLLSKETMQLAADVIGGIPAIAQSFMALEQEATHALSKIQRNSRDRPIICMDDDNESENSESDDELSVDSDASHGDGADETDMDDQSDDSDTDNGVVYSDDDEDPDEDDEHDRHLAPQWHLLRDWLLDNISHPFAYNESEYAMMLKTANVSFPTFQHWLNQMRDNIQWDKLIRNYSNGDPRKWRNLLCNAKDDRENLPPAIQAAISRVVVIIGETYDTTIPLWWEQSVSLLAGMEDAAWSGAAEHVCWSSDGSSSSDNDYDSRKAVEKTFTQPNILDCTLRMGPLAGTKRKALEMSKYELLGQHAFLPFYVPDDVEQRVAKRRKQFTTVNSPYLSRKSPSVISEASASGSSRAASHSPQTVSPYPTRSPPCASFTSLPITQPKATDRPSELTHLTSADTDYSQSEPPETPLPPCKAGSQVQILLGTQQAPPYIRSKSIPFDRKRKRKLETEDYIILHPESDPKLIPQTQPATQTPKHNNHINSTPISSICSTPDQTSLKQETLDPPPCKRFRRDNSDAHQSIVARMPSYNPVRSSSYKRKSDSSTRHEKSSFSTSQTRPPAMGHIQPIATSPCDENVGESDGVSQLLSVLEKINAVQPRLASPHSIQQYLFTDQSIGTCDESKLIAPVNPCSLTEEDSLYGHLLEVATPSLSVASPNGESPSSSGEVATPVATPHSTRHLYAEREQFVDNSGSSQYSEQTFGNLTSSLSFYGIEELGTSDSPDTISTTNGYSGTVKAGTRSSSKNSYQHRHKATGRTSEASMHTLPYSH